MSWNISTIVVWNWSAAVRIFPWRKISQKNFNWNWHHVRFSSFLMVNEESRFRSRLSTNTLCSFRRPRHLRIRISWNYFFLQMLRNEVVPQRLPSSCRIWDTNVRIMCFGMVKQFLLKSWFICSSHLMSGGWSQSTCIR